MATGKAKVSSIHVKLMWGRLAAVALVGAMGSPVMAETIAWWHFDDKEPGQRTESSTDWVVDSVRGVQAEPITVAGGSDTWHDHLTTRPVYLSPFGSGVVYDPVTGERRFNAAALNFTVKKGPSSAAESDQKPAYYAAALRVGGAAENLAEATQPTDAITVECFVRTTATGADYNNFAPIVAKRKGGEWTTESWALYMGSGGKLVLRLNAQIYGYGKDPYGTYRINDGKWHHVAFTYSATEGKARVYVDYQLDQTYSTGGGAIEYDASTTDPNYHALWIGGTACWDKSWGGRGFPGDIDELRISDAVLTSDKFLRLELPDANAYRLTFDAASANSATDAGGRPALEKDRRVSDSLYLPAFLVSASTGSAGGGAWYDAATKCADALRDDVFAPAVTNARAVAFQTNGLSGGCLVKVPFFTQKFFDNRRSSFTAECFFKTRGQMRGATQTIFQIGLTPTMKVLFKDDQPGRLYYCGNNNDVWRGSQGWRKDNPDDGQWHHVAFVYDEVVKQIRCYLDYRLDLKICVTNAMNKDASLFIGANHNTAQLFDGWIDDVRVTKAALFPEAFLCTHDVAVNPDDPTRLFATFDNTCATGPYPSFTGDWENGPKGTDGKEASFVRPWSSGLLLGGVGSDARTENRAALSFNGSAIGFPYSRLYEQEAFTIEFFGKFSKVDRSANLIRYASGVDSYMSDPVWALYRKDEATPKLQFRLAMVQNGREFWNYDFMRTIPGLEDNRWHHYAITFEPTTDGTKTRIVLYRDYQRVFGAGDKEEFDGRLNFAVAAGGRILLNSRVKSGTQVTGRFDSLRYSAGVLSPEKFIRKTSDGLSVILR